MSKPKIAAVLTTVSPRLSTADPGNRSVWMFHIDENYSLDAVRSFFDKNARSLGPLRVRHEMMRFKNINRLIAWSDRKKQNSSGMPPLTGWNGPYRLAP